MNDRKKHVLHTAKQLFIKNGFQATSIQDILDEAHISKGTFYNYFSSKNECLMAILRDAYHLSFLRRNELAIGQDLSDPQLLSDQIHIRLTMNREQNLLPLFETVVHSPDDELRQFVKQMHYRELAWIAKRLADIYGNQVKPYAYDCASLIFAFIQHSLNVWKSSTPEQLDTKHLIDFVMQRMKVVIPDIIDKDEHFLSQGLIETILKGAEHYPMTQEVLIGKLREFIGQLPDGESASKLYSQFLLDELSADAPRIYLLESVVRSFRQSFEGTDFQLQAVELSAAVWLFIDKTEC
ncbi:MULTISPECIES: TetR/AcrR family transcriptional regulator [Sporosarcina]|uniref:TetR/AcrR family transcriptional regulator n=1 Tax=Sporosarcina TaxID=1569 RepID=UPI00129BB234|nr:MULTISPECIES: TetR/AcrR family transcriptional regulator [Sporosarcina]GKV65152.1 TetR family transcriptional regulator [Sporosarcina sp. NCCP-2331]GLB55276.1 TetR family transcriptional regulator [Sporosarcina sp. NCCP-2378]